MIPQKMQECQLNSEHLLELEKSGIDEIPSNYESVDADTANKLTGHKLPGMIIYYHDHKQQPYTYKKNDNKWYSNYCRIKPNWSKVDEKIKEAYQAKSERLPKYLSPSKAGVRPYFSLFQQWGKIVKSTFNSIDITEGEKKADKACLEGFPTIGLSGVTCYQDKRQNQDFSQGSQWDIDEPEPIENPTSKFLPELEEINWQYRQVGLVFDSDILAKKPVQIALVNLANQIKNKGAFPFPVFLPNELDGSKNGLDDFLVRHGKEAYQLIRETCKTLQNSPQSILKRDKDAKRLYLDDLEPNPLLKGLLCWSVLKEKWAFRENIGWYEWTGTHWKLSSEDLLQVDITTFMDAQGWIKRSNNLLAFLTKDFKNRALVKKNQWDNKLCLNFLNGSLDIATNKLKIHQRTDYLTQCLNYEYNQLARCPQWEHFMNEAMGGDQSMIELLRAWLKWILWPKDKSERFDIEKTLDIIGRKGTGKGTFLNILIRLIGEQNCGSSSPETFSNPVNLGQLLDKKVALDTDSSGFLKNVGYFNKVVTNEPVEIKRLYKDIEPGIRLGVVVIRAYNDFIRQSSSGSEGLDRRLCIVPFNHAPQKLDTGLSKKLESELSGIFQWAWSMSINQAKNLILNSGQIKQVAQASIDRFLDTHPEFNWLTEQYQLGAQSIAAESCYSEYKKWADGNGYNALSHKSLKIFLDNLGVLETFRRSDHIYYSIAPMKGFDLVKYLRISNGDSLEVQEPIQETPEIETIPTVKTANEKPLRIAFQFESDLVVNHQKTMVYVDYGLSRKSRHTPKPFELIKAFELGQKIEAYSLANYEDATNFLGYITLTEQPYSQLLKNMNESDLEALGYPEISKNEFINQFFNGEDDQEIYVVKFNFHLSEG